MPVFSSANFVTPRSTVVEPPERQGPRILEQTRSRETREPTLVQLPTQGGPGGNILSLIPSPAPIGSIAATNQVGFQQQSAISQVAVTPFTTPVSTAPTVNTGPVSNVNAAARFRQSERGQPQRNIEGGVPANSSDVVRFAESIAVLESQGSGGYTAVGPPTRFGTAKGKYQFIDETWRRAARLVPGADRYRNALQAPPEIQDAVGVAWFESLLQRYNGDYTAVAIAHHAGEGTADRYVRTGTVGTSDVLGTQTADYARRAVAGAFG